jgi:hypothetical protein
VNPAVIRTAHRAASERGEYKFSDDEHKKDGNLWPKKYGTVKH